MRFRTARVASCHGRDSSAFHSRNLGNLQLYDPVIAPHTHVLPETHLALTCFPTRINHFPKSLSHLLHLSFWHTPNPCLHTSPRCTPHNSWCTFAHPPLETSQVYCQYITYPLAWSIDHRVLGCTTFGDSCSILLTPDVTQTIWFHPVDRTPGTSSQPPDPPVTTPDSRTPPFLHCSTCTSRLITSTEKLPEGNPGSS